MGPDLRHRILAGPEIRRTITILNFVRDRFQAVFEIGGDRVQLFVGHVSPRRPWHRHGEVMRVKWEIALPWSSGCYIDVCSLFGTQTVTKRVEDLSLGKAASSGRDVRRQILRTS